jgi:hypothetical protein
MNNWCIYWFFTYILLGILIFKGLTARRLYKSFGGKGLPVDFHSKKRSNKQTNKQYCRHLCIYFVYDSG